MDVSPEAPVDPSKDNDASPEDDEPTISSDGGDSDGGTQAKEESADKPENLSLNQDIKDVSVLSDDDNEPRGDEDVDTNKQNSSYESTEKKAQAQQPWDVCCGGLLGPL